MLKNIAGPVDTWGFAIPDPKQTIALRTREKTQLLAPSNGRRTKVLIQAFPELYIMRIQPFLGRSQLLVIAP